MKLRDSQLSEVPYSWLFWQVLNLANWSKNVVGEFKFGEHMFHARILHIMHQVAREQINFGGIKIGDLVIKKLPIRLISILAKIFSHMVI